jgi:uncharacterized protein YjbJ (UPF0337 family)
VGLGDKIKNAKSELAGRAKQKVGRATGNEQWQAEGRAKRAKGALAQAGEKVKDALTSRRNRSREPRKGKRI